MKQRLILIVGIVLFAVAVLYAQYSTDNYREQGGARTVIGGELDIVSGGELSIEDGGALYLVPTDTEPTATKGYVYFDLSESTPKYHNGATFVSFASGSGDNTLDLAYDEGGDGVGRTITADTGAVVITNTDADAAYLLEVTPTPGSSAATGGIQITSGGNATQDSLNIVNSGTGDDIEAGNGAFTVSSTGVLVALSGTIPTLTVSNSLILANGGTITNDTNNEIEFTENSEELSMAFTSNTITWATDSAIDTMGFGDVDALTGIGSIAFDAAASTITLAADGANDDLTIQVTNAQNASLILQSAGTSADALQLITIAGGIDITNGGASGGEDIDLISTNASINLTSGESATEAIYLRANGGTAETIKIHADQGNTTTSIHLLSDDGGITLNTPSGDIEFVSDMDVNADIIGDGGGDIIGMTSNVEIFIEANNVITISESGKIFTNSGDGDGSQHTLPEASTAIGCRYTFVVLAAQNLVVELDGADKFLHLSLDAGDKITSATIGDTITVMAVDATNWVVLSVYPAASDWADGGA